MIGDSRIIIERMDAETSVTCPVKQPPQPGARAASALPKDTLLAQLAKGRPVTWPPQKGRQLAQVSAENLSSVVREDQVPNVALAMVWRPN